MGRIAGALERVAADRQELRGLKSVAAEEGRPQAEIPRLPGHEPGGDVVARAEDCVGDRRANGGELGAEIGGDARVALADDYRASQRFEGPGKIFGQPYR